MERNGEMERRERERRERSMSRENAVRDEQGGRAWGGGSVSVSVRRAFLSFSIVYCVLIECGLAFFYGGWGCVDHECDSAVHGCAFGRQCDE